MPMEDFGWLIVEVVRVRRRLLSTTCCTLMMRWEWCNNYFSLLVFERWKPFQVHFQAFGGLKDKQFSKIVVDPVPCEKGDTRAYISMVDEDYLLVYSLNERKLGKLKFAWVNWEFFWSQLQSKVKLFHLQKRFHSTDESALLFGDGHRSHSWHDVHIRHDNRESLLAQPDSHSIFELLDDGLKEIIDSKSSNFHRIIARSAEGNHNQSEWFNVLHNSKVRDGCHLGSSDTSDSGMAWSNLSNDGELKSTALWTERQCLRYKWKCCKDWQRWKRKTFDQDSHGIKLETLKIYSSKENHKSAE